MHLTSFSTATLLSLLPLLALVSADPISTSEKSEAATAKDCRYECGTEVGSKFSGLTVSKKTFYWYNLTLVQDAHETAIELKKKSRIPQKSSKKHKKAKDRKLDIIKKLAFVWGPAPSKENGSGLKKLYGFDPCQSDGLSFGKQCPRAPQCVVKMFDYDADHFFVRRIDSDLYAKDECLKKFAPPESANGSVAQ